MRLHLTVVQMDVDVRSLREQSSDTDSDGKPVPLDIAMFPAKYRWDRNFVEVSGSRGDDDDDDDEEVGVVRTTSSPSGLTYTFHSYERKGKVWW